MEAAGGKLRVAQGARSVCRCVAVPRIYRDHEAIRDLGTKCPQIPGEWCEPAARKGLQVAACPGGLGSSLPKKGPSQKKPGGLLAPQSQWRWQVQLT